jgi:hypothetical protein
MTIGSLKRSPNTVSGPDARSQDVQAALRVEAPQERHAGGAEGRPSLTQGPQRRHERFLS